MEDKGIQSNPWMADFPWHRHEDDIDTEKSDVSAWPLFCRLTLCVCVSVRERERDWKGEQKIIFKRGRSMTSVVGWGWRDIIRPRECWLYQLTEGWYRIFYIFIAIATHWWSQKSSICFREIKIQLKMLVPWNILIRVHSVLKEKQGCLIFGHSRTVLHPFGKCCLVICMCVNYLGVEYASHPLTPPFSPACLIIVFVTCSSSFDSKPCL